MKQEVIRVGGQVMRANNLNWGGPTHNGSGIRGGGAIVLLHIVHLVSIALSELFITL